MATQMRAHHAPTLEKMDIILDFKSGSYSKTALAMKPGVPKSSLTRILHGKDKLRDALETLRFEPQRKRLRHGDHEELEKCLVLRLRRARSQSIPINGPLIRAKAEEFVLQLGITDFLCSEGWLTRTRHKYRGKRRRTLPKATAKDNVTPDAPTTDRPNVDTEPSDSDCAFDTAVEFISASQKKIGFFESEPRPVDAPTVNTLLCEIDALTALVAGSACPTCCERKLGVREAAGKRKGLSAFLELCCENSKCPDFTLSSTHTSRRITSARDHGTSVHFDSGSSRDSFAVNVKAVLAAHAIGAGHDQLSRFCAILGLPSPMHHNTFNGISKKLHGAAIRAVSQNMDLARNITKDAVGDRDVPVMFDSTWQKRGHKSHNGVGTVMSLDTGPCLDFQVLSNYCHACSIHKDMGG
ncbi:hypothetical protein MTO96_023165 [Rhipicephalus appendiculatus]